MQIPYLYFTDKMFRPLLTLQAPVASLPDVLVPVRKAQSSLLFVISCLLKFFSPPSSNYWHFHENFTSLKPVAHKLVVSKKCVTDFLMLLSSLPQIFFFLSSPHKYFCSLLIQRLLLTYCTSKTQTLCRFP